jgi:outer membrane receptor protein involved in Fe transport
MLERVAGVRTLSTGMQVGKPVIRGLTGSRVLVAEGGLRLEDYAWSDEDGPSIDARLADRIEVVRGPASLLYGSDALGGVVNVIAEPLPEGRGGFSGGTVEVYGASNNRELGGLLKLRGAQGRFGWSAAVIGRGAADLHTPAGELGNTGYGAVNGQLAAGLRGSWGSVGVRYTRYGGEFKLLEAEGPAAGGDVEGEE